MTPIETQSIQVPDSGNAQRLHVKAAACSVQGACRDTNEDAQYVSPDTHLFVVADGMGGHAAGELASKFAVDVLAHDLAHIAANADDKEVEYRVQVALDRANCLILDTASKLKCAGAGTTVVLALLLNHRLYVTGVGDSRAYLIRGHDIERLTIDDTWPDTMRHAGQISVDEARRHYMRNMLLSALGMEQFKADQKAIRVLDVYHGDRYLLASDGLTDTVHERRLSEIIRQNDFPQQASQKLVQEAIANGAKDDATCVVFYVHGDVDADLCRMPTLTFWQRLTTWFQPAWKSN
jgi:protein phosphatase